MARRIAILLRHGDYHQLADTPSAHQPFPLTEVGMDQARAAIRLISVLAEEHRWLLHPVVHSSNLLRAWQTAEIIIDGIPGLETLKGTDLLAERCLGSGANLCIAEIERVVREDPRFPPLPANWKSNSGFRLPLVGAESLVEAGRRVADFVVGVMRELPELSDEDRDVAVLFVGHGAAFRHSAHLLGVLTFDQIAEVSMFHARPVAIAEVGGGTWQLAGGEWKVRRGSAVVDLD